MKKILALVLALVMVLALCACGSAKEAAADTTAEDAAAAAAEEAAAVEEEPAEEADASGEMASGEMASGEMGVADVTWADYQQYLIDTAGSNAPDLDEFTAQVQAMTCWEDIDQTVSPWDQMFTTIGLSTWEQFQQGIVNQAAVSSGETDPNAGSGEASGEVAA